MIATLKRDASVCKAMPISNVPEGLGETDVMRKASKVLNYRPDLSEIRRAKETAETILRSNEIRAFLAGLDDPPFTAVSVAKYKKRMAAKAARPWSENLSIAGIACAIVALAVGIVAGLMGIFSSDAHALCGWALLVGFGLAITSICLNVRFDFLGNPMLVKTEVQWQAYSIAEYRKAIPEFAAQTATDLKERFNTLEFVIEELQVRRNERILLELSDPFLVAVLPDGSWYHLEVWNEPTFKGQRMA
ncbi:MAG: hypothetical protein HYZ62_00190 [Candidatus Andersenbacteria bacterium]|nr:hypothetical protein [Candidatus Andersenbacteria bacterium]